ncbi:MAG: hypothetical protein ACPLRZ_07750 [Thermovenabulum sp.]|uniref:hypothetical protein n=1 Tax=Thermovenabulum sp. TaxID=3100335 RepID=UPI003C7D47A9
MITIGELLIEKEKIKQAEKEYQKNKNKAYKKDYLSRYDKEEIMILAGIAVTMQKLIEKWLKQGEDRKRIKYGKMTMTYTFKTIDTYLDYIKLKCKSNEEQEKERALEIKKIVNELKAGRYEVELNKKY